MKLAAKPSKVVLSPFPPGKLPPTVTINTDPFAHLPSASARAHMPRTLSGSTIRDTTTPSSAVSLIPAPEVGGRAKLLRLPQTSNVSTSSESSTAISSVVGGTQAPSPIEAVATALSHAPLLESPHTSPTGSERSEEFSWLPVDSVNGSSQDARQQRQHIESETPHRQTQQQLSPQRQQQIPSPHRQLQPSPRLTESQQQQQWQQQQPWQGPPPRAAHPPVDPGSGSVAYESSMTAPYTSPSGMLYQPQPHQHQRQLQPPSHEGGYDYSYYSGAAPPPTEPPVGEAKWSEQRAAAREARARAGLEAAVLAGQVSPEVAAAADVVLTRETRLTQPLPKSPAAWKRSLRGADWERPGRAVPGAQGGSPPPSTSRTLAPAVRRALMAQRIARDLEKAVARRVPPTKKAKVDWFSTLRGDAPPLRPATTVQRRVASRAASRAASASPAPLRRAVSQSQPRSRTAARRVPFGSSTGRMALTPSPAKSRRRVGRSAGPEGRPGLGYGGWPPPYDPFAGYGYGGYGQPPPPPWGYTDPYDQQQLQQQQQQQPYPVDPWQQEYGTFPMPPPQEEPWRNYPTCVACGGLVDPSEAVAATEGVFHSACFACVDCGEPHLAAKGYFEVDGQPLCERDYTARFGPRCAQCSQPVAARDLVEELDRPWHRDCFSCAACCRPLGGGQDVFHRDGFLFDRDCFAARFCPRCVACHEHILDTPVEYEGIPFHTRCFVCTQGACHVLLSPSTARRTDDGRILCEKHYREYTEPPVPCARCGLGIGEDDGVTALDQNWHAACFRCSEDGGCGVDIAADGRYYELERKPFCTDHYMLRMGKDCEICKKRVPANVVVTALAHYYHPDCLRCSRCTSVFQPGAKLFSSTLPGQENRPMCESCRKMSLEPCTACKKPLRSGKFLAVRNANYHASCLKCSDCGVQLDGDIQQHEGRMYCPRHYRERTTRPATPVVPCARCGLGIGEDDGVTALEQNWHAACFRCSEDVCDVDIAADGRYYELERMPFCTKHYMLRMGELCDVCSKRIPADIMMNALGGHFHPECLCCAKCSTRLGPGIKMFASTTSGQEKRPVCENCHLSSLGTCAGCGELLRSGKYATVLGRKYHAEGGCVSCIACRKTFAKGDPMFQRDGFPVCEQHARGPLPAAAEDAKRRAELSTQQAGAAPGQNQVKA